MSDRRQRRYLALKLAGQCVKCADQLPAERESVVCRRCQDMDSANWRKRAANRRAAQ